MNKTFIPCVIEKYLFELIRRRAISFNSIEDQTFINYLCNQKIDEDYFYKENDFKSQKRDN
jgi:hypothetical protein